MEPLLREVLEDDLIGDFKCNDLLGLNLQLPEHLELLRVKGATIKDPTVQAAIGLAEPLVDQVNNILVRNYKRYKVSHTVMGDFFIVKLTDTVLSNIALQTTSIVVVIVASHDLSDQLLHLYVDNLVFFSNAQSELLFLRAWRAHEDNALRAAGCIRILQLQDAVDFFNDTHLRLATLELGDEATADVFDPSDLQVVLKNGVAGNSLALLHVFNAANASFDLFTRKIAHDSVKSGSIVLVQKDEFVGDDTHLLQSDGLSLSARETFNDPALLASLHLLNLLFHKFDDDFVAHVTVSLQ